MNWLKNGELPCKCCTNKDELNIKGKIFLVCVADETKLLYGGLVSPATQAKVFPTGRA